MPDRSREDWQEIYKDLLNFKEVVNELHDIGYLYPVLGNGKTWEEEKDTWYNHLYSAYAELINSGKVTSCECKTLLEDDNKITRWHQEHWSFWDTIGTRYYSSETYSLELGDNNLEQIITKLENLLGDNPSPKIEKELNKIFDEIGTKACDPRACAPTEEDKMSFDHNIALAELKRNTTSSSMKL